MPRSETGPIKAQPTHCRRSTGYSLIELLVVILIAGLLTTLAVLRFSGNSDADRADQALDRLAAAVDLLCDQALLTGQPHGLRLTVDGYDFWSQVEGQWRPLPPDRPPRAAEWPEQLAVTIQIEQQRLRARPSVLPQLWCSALEPIGAFEVRLGSGEDRQIRQWSNDVR